MKEKWICSNVVRIILTRTTRSKNFHILSSFNMKEMGYNWVLFLLYLNTVLSWPEDGRSRPKHVAKYNLIVIIASCLMYVVYWRYKIYYTQYVEKTCSPVQLCPQQITRGLSWIEAEHPRLKNQREAVPDKKTIYRWVSNFRQTGQTLEALKEAIRQEVAAITSEMVLKVMDNYREATSVYQYSRPPLQWWFVQNTLM